MLKPQKPGLHMKDMDGRTFTDWNGVMAELFELDSCYMIDSTQDSSSGIASDDHNATSGNSESSPTMSSFPDYGFPMSERLPLTNHPPSRQKDARGPSPHQGSNDYLVLGSLDRRHAPSRGPTAKVSLQQRYPLYQETDLDDPQMSRTTSFSSQRTFSPSPHSSLMSSPVTRSIHQTTREFFYGQNQEAPSLQAERPQDPSLYLQQLQALKKGPISYFDIVPDDIVRQIFSSLTSDQLCRCARVCRRWYNLVWDPTLWTSIWINSGEIDVDKAIKTLTKRLSYETPTVCAIVERINLNGCEKLTDKGLFTIARRCSELRHLDLQGCPNISNIALFEVVSRCVNMEHLNVAGCACVTCICLTPEATLQAATYGKQVYLRHLDMTDCYNLEDSGLQIIASYCSKLVYLYLRRCFKITDIGVQYVANYCNSLKEFSISDCHNVTDFGLRELSKLESNLRYLSVAKCERLSDVGVKYIARYCRKLRYLNVRGCEGVSDDSVEMLARYCHRLKSLDVGKCDITDDGLRALAEYCPNLRKLSLKSCEAVTDRGIVILAHRCRQMQQLNIQDCHLTVEAYRTIKKYCKRCIIEHTNPGFF